jgi:ATP-dependent helicase Lhr and Lhr-like helicase
MISYIKKPDSESKIFEKLNPLVGEWFKTKFGGLSETQLNTVMRVNNRENILLSAPTGSGKTLSAFTSILGNLLDLAQHNNLENRVYAIYVSPLKALSRDIEVNLKEPLKEMQDLAALKGINLQDIRIGVRTGDTTTNEKQKMLKNPPHILITTPESLAIMLMSYKFYDNLQTIEWAIIDEIHALAENKRGVHLNLLMEHLQNISPDMCRIGLSATVEPIEEIAKYLVGKDRKCKIAKVDFNKKFDLKVISPVSDLVKVSFEKYNKNLYKMVDELIQRHKTTLIFTNTRAGTERVVHNLKMRFPKNYGDQIGAHHGSLSKENRHDLENRLKNGEMKCVVCSTSLELGIDIGTIDLVISLGSPKGVARFLQRCGRAGHSMSETVKGRLIVTDRDDLIESSVLLKSAIEKRIDKIHIPENALDVLAQVVHSMAIAKIWNIDELYKTVTSSYCYRNLEYHDFMEIIRYLSGDYFELEDRHIYAKIWYDEESREVGKKGKMSRVINMTNVGTIPDQTGIKVKIKESVIGVIDEGFLEKLKRGDVFVIGGNTYEFLFSRGMTAQVKAAYNKSPTIPAWFSEMLPLSFDLALEIQRFRKLMDERFKLGANKKDIMWFINHYLYVDDNAANAIYKYFKEQYLYSTLPHEKKIMVEYFNDEEGKKYIIFHTLYGRKVNDVLSRAVAYVLGTKHKRDIEIGISDNGFYIASKKSMNAMKAFSLLKSEDLERIMKDAIEKSEVLKRRFRHCATRSLMILKQYKGHKKNVGRQQVASMILYSALKRISDDFSILKEARREVLHDLMDIKNAIKVLDWVNNKEISVYEVENRIPSPFAFNLITQGKMDILRMEDRMDFINRMHQQVLAKIGKDNDISDIIENGNIAET